MLEATHLKRASFTYLHDDVNLICTPACLWWPCHAFPKSLSLSLRLCSGKQMRWCTTESQPLIITAFSRCTGASVRVCGMFVACVCAHNQHCKDDWYTYCPDNSKRTSRTNLKFV